MNTLELCLKHGDDNTAELFASFKYNGFEGEGSCFVDTAALAACAHRFALFPLPNDGSVCIEGGYFNQDMSELQQTHLHISASPKDAMGTLALQVELAAPIDRDISDFEAKLSCVVPVSYEQLKNLAEAILALAEHHGDEFIIKL